MNTPELLEELASELQALRALYLRPGDERNLVVEAKKRAQQLRLDELKRAIDRIITLKRPEFAAAEIVKVYGDAILRGREDG